MHRPTAMYHTGRTTHGTIHRFGIRQLLAPHLQLLVYQDGRQPVVARHPLHFRVEVYAIHFTKRLAVKVGHMPVMRYVAVRHRHLPAAYARTNVRHAVVIAYSLVLIVGISLAGLRGQPHYPLLRCLRRAD